MIAIVLFALATPIFALPITENVQQQQQTVQTQLEQQQQQQQYQQYPLPVPGFYSVSEFVGPQGKTAAVQVPIEPDALVIPYPTPRNPNVPYPGSQYPVSPYSGSQYSHQYPEPFLVVPVPNIQKVSPVEYTPYNYKYNQYPHLLYFLPKYNYNQQYQTQYQTQNPSQVQQSQVQQVGEKTVHQVTQVQQIQPQTEQVVQKSVQTVTQGHQVVPQQDTGVETQQTVESTQTQVQQ